MEESECIKNTETIQEGILYRRPAILISIHVEDRHDIEVELVEQSSHHRVILVRVDGLEREAKNVSRFFSRRFEMPH